MHDRSSTKTRRRGTRRPGKCSRFTLADGGHGNVEKRTREFPWLSGSSSGGPAFESLWNHGNKCSARTSSEHTSEEERKSVLLLRVIIDAARLCRFRSIARIFLPHD